MGGIDDEVDIAEFTKVTNIELPKDLAQFIAETTAIENPAPKDKEEGEAADNPATTETETEAAEQPTEEPAETD